MSSGMAAAAPEHPKVSRKRGGKQADAALILSIHFFGVGVRSHRPPFLRAPASPSLSLPSPLPPTSASVPPPSSAGRSASVGWPLFFTARLMGASKLQLPPTPTRPTERPTAARRCNVVSQFVRPFSVPSISPRLVSPSLSPFPTSPVSLSSSANEALADKRGATTMLERGKRERQKKREREGSPTQSSSDILREAGSPCSILQRPPIRDRTSAAALH